MRPQRKSNRNDSLTRGLCIRILCGAVSKLLLSRETALTLIEAGLYHITIIGYVKLGYLALKG